MKMKTRLRDMTPADLPVLEEKLREQNARDGTSYSLPQIFDARGRRLSRIPLALAAVDIETGELVQGHVFEQTLEATTYGIDPEATVCSMHEQGAIMFMLRERGYRDLHIFVPESAPEMDHGLDRIFRMSRTGMKHFYRLLDPAENEAMREFYREKSAPEVAIV
jgi:hypothetical protein